MCPKQPSLWALTQQMPSKTGTIGTKLELLLKSHGMLFIHTKIKICITWRYIPPNASAADAGELQSCSSCMSLSEPHLQSRMKK